MIPQNVTNTRGNGARINLFVDARHVVNVFTIRSHSVFTIFLVSLLLSGTENLRIMWSLIHN